MDRSRIVTIVERFASGWPISVPFPKIFVIQTEYIISLRKSEKATHDVNCLKIVCNLAARWELECSFLNPLQSKGKLSIVSWGKLEQGSGFEQEYAVITYIVDDTEDFTLQLP